MRRRLHRDSDSGVATPIEMMYLLIFSLLAVMFLGYLGRLHAAGVEVASAAQSASRAASMASDPTAAEAAAIDAVDVYGLRQRCAAGPDVAVTWEPSRTGTWQGGSVTVRVTCAVRNQSLSGVWSPGFRTVAMSDTQPVDRYQR